MYPPEAEDIPKIEPEPVSEVFIEQWREYRQARADEADAGEAAGSALPPTGGEYMGATAGTAAKEPCRPRAARPPMLNIARHFLKQQQEERERLQEETPKPTPVAASNIGLGGKATALPISGASGSA